MSGPDIETAAKIIAENVVSAFARQQEGDVFTGMARDTAVSVLMLQLLSVMPTDDSDMLAAACNRVLDRVATMSMPGPQVETVDLDDGSVTMRAAGYRRQRGGLPLSLHWAQGGEERLSPLLYVLQ